MTKRRSGPAVSSRAASETATVCDQSNAIDLALVGDNADLWARLFDGEFRLAVRCSRCGRWLVASASKQAGIGPHCAAQEQR